jgi:inosine/xanthosine triphosphatase
MHTVIVASHNPVKIAAAKEGFLRMFPEDEIQVEGISVPSGVPDQPFSSQETLLGAMNRAKAAREKAPQADFWVGIEGGVTVEPMGELTKGELWALAWVTVLNKNQVGKGCTGTFALPPQIADLVHQGKELGEADDIVFGRINSKQENGAVGLLTENAIDRAAYYIQAVILALIPFKNVNLYPESQIS